jgi:hypothetical protein
VKVVEPDILVLGREVTAVVCDRERSVTASRTEDRINGGRRGNTSATKESRQTEARKESRSGWC